MSMDGILNYLRDHKATICSGLACAGVFATAYFSGKAAVRVDHTIDADMDKKEKVKEYVRAYWKTGVAAGATCALIISSDRIHVGAEAALAGAVTIWRQKATDLDKKLIEEVGADRAKEIHHEIYQAKIKDDLEHHPEKFPVEKYPNNGSMKDKLLVYEPYTDQYFYTTRETIAWVMLEANRRLNNNCDVRLNYIIKMLGGKPKHEGEILGWNWENDCQDEAWSYFGGPWIELMPYISTDKDGKDALVLFYQVDPQPDNDEDMVYNH